MLSQPTPPFHALNCTDVMFIRKGYAGMAERMMYTRSFLDMVVSRCSTGHRIGDVRRKGELAGMGIWNREKHDKGHGGFSAGSRTTGKHSPTGWTHKRDGDGPSAPLKKVAE